MVTGYILFVLATGVLETMQLFLVLIAFLLIASKPAGAGIDPERTQTR